MKDIQREWFGTAVGRRMDPDKAYNLQCVDVTDDYAQHIFGVPWAQCVGGVEGAKDLPYRAPKEYWSWHTQGLPQQGDVLVWGGSPANRYGHTAVADVVDANGAWVIQQNSNGLANHAAKREYMRWYQAGTGQLSGWLRPRPEKIRGGTTAGGVKLLTVTANPAIVRTSPRVEPGNVAPAYPHGIAKGAKVAAVGYVAGQDPYPNDGKQDDAWIKTKSEYFIWANSLGNDLSGLVRL